MRKKIIPFLSLFPPVSSDACKTSQKPGIFSIQVLVRKCERLSKNIVFLKGHSKVLKVIN